MSYEVAEVVRLRPNPGAEARMLELRPLFLDELRAVYGDVFLGLLLKCEDGTWIDVMRWESRKDAEDALTRPERFPSFGEWVSLSEHIGFEWAEPLLQG